MVTSISLGFGFNEAAILQPLTRFQAAAQFTFSEDGVALAVNQASQARMASRLAVLYADEFQAQFPEFAEIPGPPVATSFDQLLRNVAGNAFEQFFDQTLLNDLERLFRQDAKIILLSLLTTPFDIIFGFLTEKIDRILEIGDQMLDSLERMLDQVTGIGDDIAGLDQQLLLIRNAALFAAAVPLAEALLEQVNTLVEESAKFESRDFTFNVGGIALSAICAQLEAIADLLSGEDIPTVNVFARLAALQQELNRFLRLSEEFVRALTEMPDFKGNLEDSRRHLATLRAGELQKLQATLRYFIDLGTALSDKSPFEIAQNAISMSLSFKRMSSILCRDVADIGDQINDTIQANALNAINLALAQIDLSVIEELGEELASFIAIARAAVTQDLGGRFETELVAVQVSITGVVAIVEVVRAILGGWPSIRPEIIEVLLDGLNANGFSEATAALLGTGDFDSLAPATAEVVDSAGCLANFIEEEIALTTNDVEQAEFFEVRDILESFQVAAGALGRQLNAANDLEINASASFQRNLKRVEETMLKITARRLVREQGLP